MEIDEEELKNSQCFMVFFSFSRLLKGANCDFQGAFEIILNRLWQTEKSFFILHTIAVKCWFSLFFCTNSSIFVLDNIWVGWSWKYLTFPLAPNHSELLTEIKQQTRENMWKCQLGTKKVCEYVEIAQVNWKFCVRRCNCWTIYGIPSKF